MSVKVRGQIAMDETVIEDPEVEAALELRAKRHNSYSAVRHEYQDADVAAKAAVGRLELPTGGVVRVGRFRISREAVGERHVAFDAGATTRIRIAEIEENE